MRSYPIDTDRVTLISTGTVTPVAKWVELSDGSRRPDPQGRQDTDEHGRGLWRVEALTPADQDDERDKSAVVEILIASHDCPAVGSLGQPLHFDGLVMTPGYVQRKTGQLTPSRWSAEGIRGQAGGRPAKAPQGEAA
ncbi:hypothetical protein FVA95_29135 [Pseudonocardia sp. EV170527-09]|uniref:hypothetical protein n=1 Tax=Pseudonocardia sp. EV170527-09 TaxID=2603411 RepID=UPI0011F34A6F|nr:hypothetical protein [Pseudonocardia sp. EV170527-09]KAA1004410.1 hypothetical protein FVA95_29135 [Pseudonocardia sp. EV170527-09]